MIMVSGSCKTWWTQRRNNDMFFMLTLKLLQNCDLRTQKTESPASPEKKPKTAFDAERQNELIITSFMQTMAELISGLNITNIKYHLPLFPLYFIIFPNSKTFSDMSVNVLGSDLVHDLVSCWSTTCVFCTYRIPRSPQLSH